ncbi:CaiB/BaiF CoA transferase family protein [Microbacterium aurantiacum]|uniref:CoA transferase n=1 Tax=Microbacterium aurantiacum TaxID=162393 RepID=A0ABT8FW43_9MICO|nr:CaiB/BaiF CoA-transferase family protein [Microbacterium aurantiacum]MDN4465400.1 CoA transferase [Microbacterium aurantiacum]
MSRLPLEGITVVSFEQAVAAPFATRQLADLGARVIKIERDSGDFARGYDTKVRGMASYFVWLNRSKESVVLDLKSPEGMRAARELVARADVFVQNLAPGAVERMGLGAADALALNPRLIHVSISGYGESGPYRDKKAYDLLVQCEAGLVSITGTPDQPSKVGISIADIAAGMYAYTGVLTALIQRGITGEGQRVEVSMLEALAEWMGHPYFYAEYGGQPPARTGSAHATIAPYGPYRCADGAVFLAVQNEREWERFCRDVVRDAALVDDERFRGNAARVEHRDELDAVLAPVLNTLTREEMTSRLDTAAIANAELRDIAGLSQHPQLEARDRWHDVDSPVGMLRTLVPPVTANWRVRMDPVPALGADTERVLAELALPPRESSA